MNTITPRIYIAATRQNDGKTTACLGLFNALAARLGSVGYIKPVGQRYVEVDGLHIDEDCVLMEQACHVSIPFQAMNPITIEKDFTRRFLQEGNLLELEHKIMNAFDRSSWEKQFVLVEGSGHAGVGSVFGLSNARVAQILDAPVVLITRGGIGAPVDEVALSLALFEKHHVRVAGVILNKVLPSRIEMVREFATRAFHSLGLPVLGVVPHEPLLARCTVAQVLKGLDGFCLHGHDHLQAQVHQTIVGDIASRHMGQFPRGTLIIVPGDRDDVIQSILLQRLVDGESCGVVGAVLTGKWDPAATTTRLMANSPIPFIRTEADTFQSASSITEMTIKTEGYETEKIARIQHLIERHLDLDLLLASTRRSTNPTR